MSDEELVQLRMSAVAGLTSERAHRVIDELERARRKIAALEASRDE